VKEKDIEKCISFLQKEGNEKYMRDWIKKNIPPKEQKMYNDALSALMGKFILKLEKK
jgi:hypothetical protein